MKSIFALLFIVCLMTTAQSQEVVKLHRYFNSATGGHFYTTSDMNWAPVKVHSSMRAKPVMYSMHCEWNNTCLPLF
jgi:hypothetical protein